MCYLCMYMYKIYVHIHVGLCLFSFCTVGTIWSQGSHKVFLHVKIYVHIDVGLCLFSLCAVGTIWSQGSHQVFLHVKYVLTLGILSPVTIYIYLRNLQYVF